MKIKAVIFDLDGTLLDTIEDIADANNLMLRSYGYPEHSIEKYIEWIGCGAKKLVLASLPSNVDCRKNRIQDYLDEYKRIYSNNIDKKTRLFNGIDQVLDYLSERHIPVSINTNKPQELTTLVFRKFLQNWSFRFIYGQSDKFSKKPNAGAAEAIASGLGTEPGNILFIGDSITDLETAENAGMPSIGVLWGYGNKEQMEKGGAVKMINHPLEIIEFIKSNN